MKKSEMISKFHDILLDACEESGVTAYGAELILDQLLKAGMLPPSCEFKMGTTTVRDNCWEPENETK